MSAMKRLYINQVKDNGDQRVKLKKSGVNWFTNRRGSETERNENERIKSSPRYGVMNYLLKIYKEVSKEIINQESSASILKLAASDPNFD